MLTHAFSVRGLESLRDYVTETFCEQYELQLGAFHMTERILRRGGRPCGVCFYLQGPRAVRFTAIWDADHNQVLFYGASGERFLRTQLVGAPSLERVAA